MDFFNKEKNKISELKSLADSYLKNEQYEKCLKCGELITSLSPNDAYGWSIMGDAYCLMENFEESIPCFEKALKINPADFLNWNQLAIAFEEVGKIEESITAFYKVIQTNPDNLHNRNDIALESISYLKGLEKESESTELEDELMQDIMTMGDLGVESAFNNKPVSVECALDRLDLIRIKTEKYDMTSATEMVIRQIERIRRAM